MQLFHCNRKDTEYPIAILVKDLNPTSIDKYYINPLNIDKSIITWKLDYSDAKKPSAATMKQWCDDTLPKLKHIKVKYLLISDGSYFTHLTKKQKPSSQYGYSHGLVKYEGYDIQCILVPSFSNLFYNPKLKDKIVIALDTLKSCLDGTYKEPGNIIKSAYYPDTVNDIFNTLKGLHKYTELTVDIETKGLKIDEAGLETIAFSWNDCEGIAFSVGKGNNILRKKLLGNLIKSFITCYKGKLIGHNIGFDIKILIYELWMKNIDDVSGLLTGLDIMTRDIDDTQILLYLATNTTAGNKLSLKDAAHDYAGNYAQSDIADTTLIKESVLLEYNLTDCCSTYWVYKKYYPIAKSTFQLELYKSIYLPALKLLIQTELTGMPVSMDKVRSAEKSLLNTVEKHLELISESRYVHNFKFWLQHKKRVEHNLGLKKKVCPYSDFPLEFNSGSGKQKAMLFHEFLGYKVLDTTATGLPATGNDELKKLATTTDDETKAIIDSICEVNTAQKIVSTFISAFKEKSILHTDGLWYLHGSFRLGGTVSSRISSNSPNLMNLPSNSIYGKLIKACFISPPGYLMVGSDFANLESRVAALVTRDPNSMIVYTKGYDSHALAAFFYFRDQMPDIVKELKGFFD